MKVTNKTEFRTDDLRKIFKAGLIAEGAEYKRYWITVRKSRKHITGSTWYTSHNISINLPSDAGERLRYLAQVFVHEIGHTLGLRHSEMTHYYTIKIPWLNGMVLRKKTVKVKPKEDLRTKRYQHALKMFKSHKSNLKREENLVKKWGRKVKYYEKAIKESE